MSEAVVPFFEAHNSGNPQSPDDILRHTAFLSYWIASLNVLSEGWRQLKLTDSRVDPLLTKDHLKTLRNYRNTVFHFQRDLEEPRIGSLIANAEVIAWVLELGTAYQNFFENHSDAIDVERIRPWLFA